MLSKFTQNFTTKLALLIVALSLVAAPASHAAAEEFLYLNQKELHWIKSPNGYTSAPGHLLVLRADGQAALISCSFYRDEPDSPLMFGDVGGFYFEAGRWSKVDANPCILTLQLHLIDADKVSKNIPSTPSSVATTTKFTQSRAGALKDLTTIRDARGAEFVRIKSLKNQNELDAKLDRVK